MNRKSLTIATILWSSLIIVGVSVADDINLDKPRFKAGDCLVWTAPMSATSSVVKIKKLNTLTFKGQTAYFYEIESGKEVDSIQTWQFDVGGARKFNCTNFDKIKSEVESRNKTIQGVQESLEEAERESHKFNQEYSDKQRKIETDFLFCKQTHALEESLKNCAMRKDAEESSLRKQQEEVYQSFKSKYPLINITFNDGQIFVN